MEWKFRSRDGSPGQPALRLLWGPASRPATSPRLAVDHVDAAPQCLVIATFVAIPIAKAPLSPRQRFVETVPVAPNREPSRQGRMESAALPVMPRSGRRQGVGSPRAKPGISRLWASLSAVEGQYPTAAPDLDTTCQLPPPSVLSAPEADAFRGGPAKAAPRPSPVGKDPIIDHFATRPSRHGLAPNGPRAAFGGRPAHISRRLVLRWRCGGGRARSFSFPALTPTRPASGRIPSAFQQSRRQSSNARAPCSPPPAWCGMPR